ncbi:MAG: STAS domain-containing protein [Leptospirales bacterium]|nr:STAS domain-containing protein [Leptospirales bacterium]
MLDLATDRRPGVRVVTLALRGRMDGLTAPDFEAALERLIQRGNRFFVLRCSQLDGCSSSGIAALLKLVRRLETLQGAVALCEVSLELSLLFDFFGLAQVLPRFKDAAAAEAELRAKMEAGSWSLEMSAEATATPLAEAQPDREALESWPASSPTVSRSSSKAQRLSTRNRRPVSRKAAASMVDNQRAAVLQAQRQEQQPLRGGVAEAEHDVSPAVIPEAGAPADHDNRSTEADAVSVSASPEGAARIALDDAGPPMAAASGPRAGSAAIALQSSGQAVARKTEPGVRRPTLAYDSPRQMQCPVCAQELRTYRNGPHLCPSCGNEFDSPA